jgi:CheY-like chemotaxis protein/anti-sigma regulatory factor (Ser/Thr protein kinase)
MSHEIRTPLNGVLGMVQIMQRDATDTVQRSRLTIIADAGQALLTALNNVLDLAKVEAGKFGLELQPFDLEDTVRQAIAAHEPLAGHKALDIRLAIDPQALGAWRGDGAKLRQVLAGLLSNAIKFTARGRIELRIAACPDGLAFEVEDSGIGIAEHQLEPIFDSFFQVDSTTTRRFGGTGLGLTICRHLVRLMGGDVTVSSREGVGSVFAFTLPLERSATPVRQPARLEIPAPNDRQRALRVLVAEDNPMNRLVLEGMLEPLDVVVTSVENGRDAVAAFTTQAFDLVLMDIHMPEMDGVEATILMRESETGAHRRRTPILALTANVMPHQLDTYGAAGMDGASPSR